MKHFNRTITVLVFIFLYIPMIVLAVASFNTGTDIASFKGFTFRQYANLFRDGTLLTLLRNSVIIALLATLISTVVGTMAAVGIHSMKGRLRSAVMTMTNIPMTNPDIVTGVALALLFAADLTLTLITVLGLDKRLRAAREAFREQLEERIPHLRGLHAFQMKRLSRAFPALDFTRYHEEWLRLRERLRHKPLRMDGQKEDGSFR